MIDSDILQEAAGPDVLGILETRNFFKRLDLPPPSDETPLHLHADVCLRYWLEILFKRIPFIEGDQIDLIRSEIDADITGLGGAFQHDLLASPNDTTAGKQMILAFADGQYCTWTGRNNWLSLATGESMGRIPLTIESVAYNLKHLFAVNLRAANKLQSARKIQQAKDARAANNPASRP